MSTKSQTIFRVLNPGSEFTIISNKLCKHASMSMECKGFLLTVLCLPDDWAFRPKWLMSEYNIGRNEVYRCLQEAISLGFCLKIQVRDKETGRLTGELEYVFASDPDILSARFPTCRDAGDRHPDIPTSGKSVPIERTDLGTKKNTQSACASGPDGGLPTDLVSYRDGILELHGSELEDYLSRFDGDGEALRSALIQAAAHVQPNSSRPLLVQVRAQLQRKLDQRRDFKAREEARKREQVARKLAPFGQTKSQAIKAKAAEDARLDKPLQAPVWKLGDPEEVERYESNNPFFAGYLERLEQAGRHADAAEIRARGWVKTLPSKFMGRRALA